VQGVEVLGSADPTAISKENLTKFSRGQSARVQLKGLTIEQWSKGRTDTIGISEVQPKDVLLRKGHIGQRG
jgi:hypothetical protein